MTVAGSGLTSIRKNRKASRLSRRPSPKSLSCTEGLRLLMQDCDGAIELTFDDANRTLVTTTRPQQPLGEHHM